MSQPTNALLVGPAVPWKEGSWLLYFSPPCKRKPQADLPISWRKPRPVELSPGVQGLEPGGPRL